MAANTVNAPQKFLFDTSFERAAKPHAPEKVKAAPEYFDADLERARAEGLAAGEDAGRRAAMQDIEQATAQALTAVAQQLPALEQALTAAQVRQSRTAIEVATAVARKLFPKLAQRHGLAEIESMVAETLEHLREEPRIVIRVADPLLDIVKERVGALAETAGFEGRIIFLSQDAMTPGDVRVEWADGGAERDTERLWRDIDTVIQRMTGVSRGRPAPASDPSIADEGATVSA